MIEPTVGRIVWFFTAPSPTEAQAAIVTRVWSNVMVNLTVFHHDGTNSPVTSVDLLQDDAKPGVKPRWCEWMPYQKGQAAKHEALEKMNQKVSA